MIKKLIIVLILAVNSLAYTPAITSFNAGQISPLMEARADFQKYNSSCRLIENMLVTVQGPVLKRPGTKYIVTAKTGSIRLLPFEYSTDDAYILELGDEYMRFCRDGGQILDDSDDIVEETTEFDSDEIWDIQYAQTDNSMYMVDGSDPPQILTRADHDDWTIADVSFTTGPFLPLNTTTTTITPSATSGSVTLTSSTDIFESGHTGSLWQIDQRRASSVYQGVIDANESSSYDADADYFVGGYSFTTTGTWAGTITLERSTDGGSNWDAALTALTGINFDNPAETEEDGAIYRVTGTNWTPGESCSYTFTITDQYNHGIVEVTAVTDGSTATATVLTNLVNTNATTRWREGYWSDYRGWPKTVVFHQQRLIFGGSDSFPQTIWFGKADPDDYANFTEGTLDTSAFTIALPGQNPIRWLLSQDYLLIGTSGSCGKYGEQGKAITPTSPNYQEQTRNGSASIQAVFASNTALYIERGARKVREFGYSLQSDKYESTDLNILSAEITDSGIKDAAFQLRPDPVFWCVLNDGDIATLTYQRKQSVIAWAKQVTDGDFESVAIIPGTDEDEVWVSVNRTIEGTDYRYIEQFQPRDWGTDQNDCFFVDSGLSYSGSVETDFGGLDHLVGETVSVWADGIVQPDVVVDADGEITIGVASSEVIIGLPYTAKLETLPIRASQQDVVMNKKIKRLHIDFYKTGDCKYSNSSTGDLTQINFFEGATLSAKQDLYTSDVTFRQFPFPYSSMRKMTVYLESAKPVPLCVRAIIPEMSAKQ